MEMMRQEFGEAYVENLWQKLRDTGGDYLDSHAVATKDIMWYMAKKAFGDGNAEAKEWFKVVVGPEHAQKIEKMWQLRNEIEKLLKTPKPIPPELPPPPPRDPLALDLNGDGVVKTLPISRNIHFDLDNSGFAERTSWVAPEDGLLVLDRNSNNFIDGGAELFGTETLLANGKYAAHGFEALAEFDINKDGVVDASDAIYSSLRVWRDANSNGVAETSELKKLTDVNIKSIGTAHTNINTRDANNVDHREAGTFTYNNSTKGITNTLWFESDRRITTPVTELQGNITIPHAIKKLPNIVGFGNTYSLCHTGRSKFSLVA